MMRSFFRNHRAAAYIGLTLLLTVVCTVGFFTWQHMDVFGKFKAEEPYVKNDAVVSPVTVTSEGSNQKGKMGSGAKPLSKEIPTCEGMKGSKSNPFVVLEVVPDKAQQQLIYLGQDEGGTYPLDIMKIGIELAKEQGKTYANSSSQMDNDKLKSMGQWFSNYSYDVYKIGSDTQKEKLPFAYIDKLYTLTISDEEIAAKTGDKDAPERFAEIFKETTEFAARKWHDIEKLSEQFPDLFVKDSKGKEIRDIALSDPHNWEAEWKEGVTAEEESETYASGFIITVEPGEGDFGFANQEDCNNWVFTKTGTDADRFVYVKDEEELEDKYPGYLDDYEKKGALYQWNVSYDNKNKWGDLKDLYRLQESEELTGLMLKINNMSCKYIISPEIKENYYTFKYFGVTNNNILKRALFTFKDEKDYEGFHMEIICMTPAELNKLCKNDTEETVDMIERADMYFIQSGSLDGSTVNETEMLEDMYYEHVALNETKSSENITFYENDLEWSLCQKIIQRQSQVQTLPLMFNQMVGRLLELGISRNESEKETHMYVTAGKEGQADSRMTDVKAKGSRNNLSKLYLISVQFDLLARKENSFDIEYDKTFMEDIYPNIKTVSLPKEDGVVDGTATTTGYYDGTVASPRKLCTCELPDDKKEAEKLQKFKERTYYLWNTYTFLPVDIEANFNNIDKDLKEKLIQQGYQDTFFDTNANPFRDVGSPSHQSGSDGNDEKNVTIVSDPSNSNTNHSSILGNKGDSGGIASKMLDILYMIMNNQTDTIQSVTVTAEEQRKIYVKLADDAVMLDYEEDGKIRADRQLYLKVRIWNNENNRPGQVKSIELMNDKNGNTVTKRLYTDKTFTTECAYWKNPETEEVMEGQYAVSPDDAYLEGYVPFRLNEWKSGFTTIRFKTVGWINNRKYKGPGDKKNPKQLSGEVHKTDISLIGKTLFDLE